jgi:serine/threonine protein phosphatase PrpC
MLDNVLTMNNVNSFLKTFNSNDNIQKEFGLEFLQFSLLSNEVFINEMNATSQEINNFYSKDCALNNLNHEDSFELKIKVSSTENSDTNYSNDEKPVDELFKITTYDSPEVSYINEIYSFGGTVVQENKEINNSYVSFSVGTTANVVFIRDGYCYVANVGDSLAVLYKNGKAIRLNTEHKPSVAKERERVINSGNQIVNNRVSGRLNLTRAIGDFIHKNNADLNFNQQAVICLPEINKFKITSDMQFIIMGCDGIWDCVEIQKFCDFISKKLKEKVSIPMILKELFSTIISKSNERKFGSDNMTCMIIEFDH